MAAEPLGKMLRDLAFRWKHLLVLPCGLAFATAVVMLFAPTEWSSRATLEFPSMPSALALVATTEGLQGGGGSDLMARLQGGDRRLKRYIAILKSERLRTQMIEKPSLRAPLRSLLRTEVKEDMLDALNTRVKFNEEAGRIIGIETSLPGPSTVSMLFSRKSPGEAQETAAALTRAYIEDLRHYLNEVSASHERSEREYIEPQVEASYERLLRIQEQQVALLDGRTPVLPKEEHLLLAENMRKLAEERASISIELSSASRQISAAKAQLASAPAEVVASLDRAKNPEIDRLQALLADAQTRFYVLRNTEGKAEKHPEVRAEAEKIKQIEGKLQEALRHPLQIALEQKVRSPVYEELEAVYHRAVIAESAAKAKLAALDRVREESLARLQDLTGPELEQIQLESDYQMEHATYIMLRKALEEVKIREKRTAEIFVVLDVPRVPERKSGPRLVLNTLIGFMAGVIIAIAMVELRNQFSAWYESTKPDSANTIT